MHALQCLFRLILLCTKTKEGKIGIVLFISVFVLNLLNIQVSLKLIKWNGDFYNALSEYNSKIVVKQIGIFAILTALSAIIYLLANYLRQILQMLWRKTLTNAVLSSWISNKNYSKMDYSSNQFMDNPDQRIAEDCRIFVEKLTTKALDLFSTIIALFSYFAALWTIANFTLSFAFFGFNLSIPHYIVWAAPIYVFSCSLITHFLGAPLMKLKMQQKQKEADFRFSLTRFRENAQAIALENGEKVEENIFNLRFSAIIKNWMHVINRELILGSFTRPYMSTILRIPTFLALPIYLINREPLGTLMQTASAFQNVATNLSWFIFSYRDLAELIASSERIAHFIDKNHSLSQEKINKKAKISINKNAPNQLEIKELAIFSPENKPLLTINSLIVKEGEWLELKGDSGIGKSTLLRTLAKTHLNFSGTIYLPQKNCYFLPQKNYFPLGGLAHTIVYPQLFDEKNKEKINEIKKLLNLVGFSQQKINDDFLSCDLSQYSGGEQQRLLFARILFNKPDWLFLDENTNALDKKSEAHLFYLLETYLPNLTCILISHHPLSLNKHTRIIELN